MIEFFKDGEIQSPETIINELSYGCFAYNRSIGMSAESALSLWPETGEAMEARYQSEHGGNDNV